jgi:hypothetical protein
VRREIDGGDAIGGDGGRWAGGSEEVRRVRMWRWGRREGDG